MAYMLLYDMVYTSFFAFSENAIAILITMAHPKITSFGLYNRYDCFLYEQVRG